MGGSAPWLDVDMPAGGLSGSGGVAGGETVIDVLPDGFIAAEIGGFQRGEALGDPNAGEGGAGPGEPSCSNILLAVVRDFRGRDEPAGHPDFQGPFWGSGPTSGLVGPALGPSGKPVYASVCEEGVAMSGACPYGGQTSGATNFDQWFTYVPEVNLPFVVRLFLAPQPGGLFTFKSSLFFPLDGAGYGDLPGIVGDDGKPHNFSFTTELRTKFEYKGGEVFTFSGDDDVWVYINGKLAVDLGGLHAPETSSISLDERASALGLTQGTVYDLDLFHAERHDKGSNFRIDSNLSFVGCGMLPPDVAVR